MSRSSIKYKHIVENVIKILQKQEEENGELVHSYEEWIELLKGDLKDDGSKI